MCGILIPESEIYELKEIPSRGKRRKTDWTKARRKQNICRHTYGWEWYINAPHAYSKGKIHCSCPLCSCKTNNKGRKTWGAGKKNWSMQDKRRIEEMRDAVLEMEMKERTQINEIGTSSENIY